MPFSHRVSLRFVIVGSAVFMAAASAAEPQQPAMCLGTIERSFSGEVWEKVAAKKCLTCHQAGGEAEKSKLVLLDPNKIEAAERTEAMRKKFAAFARISPRCKRSPWPTRWKGTNARRITIASRSI